MTQVYRSPNFRGADITESQRLMQLLRIEQDKEDEKRGKIVKAGTNVGTSAWKVYSGHQKGRTSDMLAETFDVQHDLKGGGSMTEKVNIFERDPNYTNQAFWKKPFTPSGGRVRFTDKYTEAHTFKDTMDDWDFSSMTPEAQKKVQESIVSGKEYLHAGKKPEGYIGKWGTETVEGAETLKDQGKNLWSAFKDGKAVDAAKNLGGNIASYGQKASKLGTKAGNVGFGLEVAGDIYALSDENKRKNISTGEGILKAAKYAKYVSPDPFMQTVGWGATLLDMVV